MTEHPADRHDHPAVERAAGVYVLGMHRSGTSLIAGLLDRLGIDGGPRTSMLSPDPFNSDGYWEQRPIVEWHDSVLTGLRGWASAPPEPPDGQTLASVAAERTDELAAVLSGLYHAPWFLKDPRQCLLLGLWSRLRGNSELAVVVSRTPGDVIRSLQRRNSYPYPLAAALWERYTRDLLIGLDGRPCLFVRYEQVTAQPEASVAALAEVLDRHAKGAAPRAERAAQAIALVRAPAPSASTGPGDLTSEQRALDRLLLDLDGYHEQFRSPEAVPRLTPASARIIEQRRDRLNRVGPLLLASSDLRARLDRLPSLWRSWSGRVRNR